MNRTGAAAFGASGALAIIGMAMAFIEPHEGKVNTTYTDPAGYATVCVGNRSAALPGLTFTDEECDLLLLADVIPHVLTVEKLARVPLTQDEWVAMASLSFNVGTTAFAKSTLLAKLNAGDRAGAADEFQRWRLAGGRVLPGLVVRRAAEAALFRGG